MKVDSVLIFETENAESLYPFSILHPAWELRCGALRIYEKVEKRFPKAKIQFTGRPGHLASFKARFGIKDFEQKRENILILHSAIIPDKSFLKSLEDAYENFKKEKGEDKSVAFTYSGTPVASYVVEKDRINPTEKDLELFTKFLYDFAGGLEQVEVPKPKVVNYLWDAIYYNGEGILDDFAYFDNEADFDKLKKDGVHLIGRGKIRIGKNNSIYPGTVLDAAEGPIVTGENVTIMPNAVVVGPVYIGDNSTIKAGAKIYEDTSIGEWCKVGGEVENSIIQSYSNKQHDGFLGHSFLSEWINIGADTNTSDLKNTYGDIKVMIKDREIDTGKMFLGLLCGDHTKTAINTTLNTGTVAGICGILVADGFLPKQIPSFAWRGTKGCSIYKPDKAIKVARKVMARRNRELLDEEMKLIEEEYNRVAGE